MKRQFWYRILVVPLFLGLFAGVVAVTAATPPPQPQAVSALITVDTTADDLTNNGNCTLREAIHAANTGAAVDTCPAGGVTTTIMIPAGTYTLTIPGNLENNTQTGDLDILSEVVIIGAGEQETILNGGGLDRVFDVRDAGDATISHLTITGGGNNGTDTGGGGARAVEGGAIHLSHVHVTENSSDGAGGGLSVLTGTLTIENSQISHNIATGSGGGVINRNGSVVITNSHIQENEAGTSGGGLGNSAYDQLTTMTIMDSTVMSNTAAFNGGGLQNGFDTAQTATLTIERVNIIGNSAFVGNESLRGLGGGVGNAVVVGAGSGSGIVHISDSVIQGNMATNGGGIGSTPATATGFVSMNVTVERTVIRDNMVSGAAAQTGNGAGILSLDGTFTMINSTVTGNTAAGSAGAPSVSGLGGGLLIGSQSLPGNVTLVANTIANNTAVTGASGIVNASLGGPANLSAKNNILANNVGANCVNQGGTATSLGYNLDSGPTCTFFNQASDLTNTNPMLGALTADGSTFVHPLMAGSPAIDAGSCTDANGDPLTTDQRGVGRPQGAGCDMGAYEWVLPAMTIDVDSTADDLTNNGNCTLREAIEAANTKAAVDMCPAGGLTTTIMVPAGTYTLTIPGNDEDDNKTGDLDILSNIILQGAGAEETILDGNGLDRVLDVIVADAVHISNLTVTGGSVNDLGGSGGGISIFMSQVSISDATIRDNTVTTSNPLFGGGGGGVYVSRGMATIANSEISNNQSFNQGGGVYVRNSTVVISQTTVQENSTQDSSGGGIDNTADGEDSSVTIIDSQIISNTAANNAGGVGSGFNTGFNATLLIERTLISGNSAAVDNDADSGLGGGVGGGVIIGATSGSGSVTIRDSVIRNNQATNGGGVGHTPVGAISFVTTETIIENSVIADNTAVGNAAQTGNGGGIIALDGSLTVMNSTLSGNTAAGTGGGAALSGLGGGILVGSQALPNNVTLVANTIVDNTAVTGASGLANVNVGGGSTVTAKNNILADNMGANCVNNGGTITSLGYNLDSGPTCAAFFNQASDLSNTNPMLGALTADGSTFVHPLMAGSPAIDAGSCTDANGDPILFDQRGMSRPQGATCDIGAYEFEGTAATPDISVNPTSLGVTLALGESVTETLTIQNDGDLGTDFELRQPLPVDVISDGSFEAGTPNPDWDEASTNYGTPLCTIAVCGTGGGTAGPRTGDWWAWLGGSSNVEVGSVAQDVVIPTGSATLSFYLWIGTTGGSTTDYFAVEMDGNEIFRVTEADQPAYSSYTPVTLDVTAYADGGTHTVTFLGETNSALAVNFNLDDVVLESSMDVAWLSTNPVTGTVGANSSTTADILFDTSVLTETGNFTATLQLVTDDPNSPLEIPVYLTVTAPINYGVDLSAVTTELTGTVNTAVTYTLSLTNTGDTADTFDIDLTGAVWAVTGTTSITLGAGETVQLDVTVWVPADAADGAMDSVTVTATSQGDDTVSDSVVLMTTAVAESTEPTYGVDLSATTTALSGTVGTAVTYTLSLENTGDMTDTFDIDLTGAVWAVTGTTSITLSAGETVQLDVTVWVPADAADGAMDSVTVTATSQGDDTVSDSVVLMTTAVVENTEPPTYTIFLPLVTR